MRKIALILAFISFICLAAGCAGQEQTDYSSMDYYDPEAGFAFNAPEGFTVDAQDPDGYIYVYATGKAVPYIMIRKYEISTSLDDFKAQLKRSMADTFGNCFDEEQHNNIGGKKVLVLKFAYRLDDYDILDTRCIYEKGGAFYVFTTKEAAALGHNLNAELDYLMKNFIVIE